ncbi:T9SS type A sorting domain-containing protein [bacterium SCSIO 12741]|nr:T9SS type A sorting domain-containing protein [bacterium SCSIO 12741]
MKISIPLFIATLVFALSTTQGVSQMQTVDLSLGADYEKQSFYSLSMGEQANVDNTNWDIAFDLTPFGSGIRINGGTGTKLYSWPNGKIADWASVDTLGLSTWKSLNNSDTSWGIGAFNMNSNGSSTDLGWGIYNTVTHAVEGDSIYVIVLADKSVKKLEITKLKSGTYSFRHANLDGTGEVMNTVKKSDYAGKRLAYYSLKNDQGLDREPADWDLVFTKYVTQLAPGVYYGVTGVLLNSDRTAQKASPVGDPETYSDYQSGTFLTAMNTIGYNWKRFNMQTFSYDLADSTCYFVKDQNLDVYRLVFTAFDGSSTGDISFKQEKLTKTSTSIAEQNNNAGFSIYPNPANDVVNVTFEGEGQLMITDMSGKTLQQHLSDDNGWQVITLDIAELSRGAYLIHWVSENQRITRQLIVE